MIRHLLLFTVIGIVMLVLSPLILRLLVAAASVVVWGFSMLFWLLLGLGALIVWGLVFLRDTLFRMGRAVRRDFTRNRL